MKKINRLKISWFGFVIWAGVVLNANAGVTDRLEYHFPLNGNADEVVQNAGSVVGSGVTFPTDAAGRQYANFTETGVIRSTGIDVNYQDFSIALWIKQDTVPTGFKDAFALHSGNLGFSNGGDRHARIEVNQDSDPSIGPRLLSFASVTDGAKPRWTGTNDFTTTNWVHIAFIRMADGNLTLFINGQETGSGDYNRTDRTSSHPTPGGAFSFIGGNIEIGGSNFYGANGNGPANRRAQAIWNGGIDDVRIYSKALSRADVLEIMAEANLLSPWTFTASTNSPRTMHGATEHNGFIYAVGGHDYNNPLNTVEFTTANPDGTLNPWTYTTPLPVVRRHPDVVAANGHIYVIGGSTSSSNFLCTVLMAPINPDGTVGSWSYTSQLNQCRERPSAIVNGNKIYAIGGSDNISARFTSVEYATVNGDGTLGAWQFTSPTNVGRGAPVSAAYNNFLYSLGGSAGTSGNVTFPVSVEYAQVNPDGTLGPWQFTTTTNIARGGLANAVLDGKLFAIGGNNGNSAHINSVEYAPINADGSIGAWTIDAPMNSTRSAFRAVELNGYIYAVGGNSENQSGALLRLDSVEFTSLDANEPLVDTDGDGVLDVSDNCPAIANADQDDNDLDGAGDVCDDDDDNDGVDDTIDNCPTTLGGNDDQTDSDGDGAGDICDTDLDGDGVPNGADNCPMDANGLQTDNDSDGAGDACDPDDDNDGVDDDVPDNCPLTVNADQADQDGDNIGDACDSDVDGDGSDNDVDNCPLVVNASQDDTDTDGVGDACDEDDDNDGICDGAAAGDACSAGPDNCSLIANMDQTDTDGDGAGDACDGDLDGDGAANDNDNCPTIANTNQNDFDQDGVGDACDTDIDGDGVDNGPDICASTPTGEVVDPGTGCSIAQLCPCDGPRGSSEAWRNHGKYVSCVTKTAKSFVNQGLISDAEKSAIVSAAGQSDCGKK